MATQTLLSRRDKTKFAPLHVELPAAPAARSRRSVQRREQVSPPQRPIGVEQAKDGLLARVEERLVAAAIEHHPHSDVALDELLADLDLMEQTRRSEPRRVLPFGDPTRNDRMEDLLLEAIIRTHPNRDAALDRLLADACGDAAGLDEPCDEAEERARFDAGIDNDFDGMA